MRNRRRHLAVLLVAVTVLCGASLPFARPAAAATSNTNACFSAVSATYSEVPISMAGTATPDSVTVGTPVTLSGTTVTAEFSASLFLAGYRLFLLSNGANSVSATIDATIKASNTTEQSHTDTVSTSVTVTINDPTPASRSSGDESAQPLSVPLSLANTTWTPTGGTIAFTQGTFTVHATVGGTLPVDLGPCEPSAGLTGCTAGSNCTGFTPGTATPFATVASTGGSSSSSSPSSTTSTPTAPTSTTTSPTSPTTSPTTTTTTAPVARTLPAGRADMTYTCRGADTTTQDLLDGLGLSASPPVQPPNRLDLSVALANDSIPSPAKGAAFQLPLRWTVALPDDLVTAAVRLRITSANISGTTLVAGVTAGASGADSTFRPPDRVLTLATSAGFTVGPTLASWTRTGEVGEAIVVQAKQLLVTATINLGNPPMVLKLVCDPPAASSIRLVDGVGTTTPTTAAAQVLAASTTRSTAASPSLARTGVSHLPQLALVVILLDLGYLALSASRGSRQD